MSGGPALAPIIVTTDRVRLRDTRFTPAVSGAPAGSAFNVGTLPALFTAAGISQIQVQTSSQTNFENANGVEDLAVATLFLCGDCCSSVSRTRCSLPTRFASARPIRALKAWASPSVRGGPHRCRTTVICTACADLVCYFLAERTFGVCTLAVQQRASPEAPHPNSSSDSQS